MLKAKNIQTSRKINIDNNNDDGSGGLAKSVKCEGEGRVGKLENTRQSENKENLGTFFEGNFQAKQAEKIFAGTSSTVVSVSSILKEGSLVNTRYRMHNLVGSGTFGEVYRSTDETNGSEVALKIEKLSKQAFGLLGVERKVYEDIKGLIGFPRVFSFDKDCITKSSILVMDLLGRSLGDLLKECGGKFSLNTTAMLTDQMIERIEALHSRNYLHRDIKPDNFLLGLKNGKESKDTNYYWTQASGEMLYLIDFGIAKKYRDSNFKHISFRCSSRGLVGNPFFASIRAHFGSELSRRDDLLSIGYMILYFIKGRLPWQGLTAATKIESDKEIGRVKMATPLNELYKGVPPDYLTYMEYCTQLQFDEVPDYEFLRSLFRKQISSSKAARGELVFDWNKVETVKPS